MARLQTFAKDIQLATASIAPEAINAELAKFARAELTAAVSSGQASPIFETFVNNRAGANEESVIAPGPILYVFSWWPEIIEFALEFLQRRSPVRSGRFRDSWFAMVGETAVTAYEGIPVGAEVVVTNTQPYARKIEVGHMRMSVPHGVVEDGRQAVQRQYGKILEVKKTFVTLPGGYILKGVFSKGVRPSSRPRLRPDVRKGQPVTYPAIVLRMRGF